MVNTNLAYQSPTSPVAETTIKEIPVKWCSVSLSDVVSKGKRLEASVFDVEAKQAVAQIQNSKFGIKPLTDQNWIVEEAYHAPRFKRNYVQKTHPQSVGFLGSAEVLDVYPRPQKYMPSAMARELDLFPSLGTVLLSCSGTIGNISYVGESLSHYAISQHLIKLKCNAFSGYLYTCLKHPTVQQQIKSLIYGAVIQEIEPEHLSKVSLPDASKEIKERIHNLIVRSYELRDESNDLIDQATQLLINELHLPDIHAFDVKDYKKNAPVETYSVKLSDMNGRADASYHVPIVDAIVEHLKKYADEVTTVGDARVSKRIILAGVFKRTYVEEGFGYPFLGGKEIIQLAPRTEKFLSRPIHKARYEKELKVEENMILVTDRGTIGTVALVPKHWNGYAVSQNVLKVIPANNEIAGYLYIFLDSEWGRRLTQRQTYGSVVDMIDNNSLSYVEFPLLKNKEVQKRINDLALEANEKRYEAYKLEQQALRIMDNEVIYAK